MRTMQGPYGKINVVEHIMTRNFWEYYVTDEDEEDEDIKICLVMGNFTEIGCVSIDEIKPYITSRTKDLKEIMPAEGWKWVEV